MEIRGLLEVLRRWLRQGLASFWVSIRGTTPGQYWTSALALLVALPVLLFGLPPATTLVASAPDPQPRSTNPPISLPPTDAPSGQGIPVGPPRSVARPGPGSIDQPTDPGEDRAAVTAPPANDADPAPQPAPPSPSEPCPPVETVESVLDALAAVELVPRKSVVALIGGLAGCSEIDPALFSIAVVAEIGSGLPDPGLEVPVPTLPFVEIPPAAVGLAQPLRDVFQPLCDTAALASPVILVGLSTWPTNVDQVLLVPVSHVLLACGQLLTPEASILVLDVADAMVITTPLGSVDDGWGPTGVHPMAWSVACMCWQNQ